MTIVNFAVAVAIPRLTTRFGHGRLVNVAHQLGGSLGLGILVTIFAAAGSIALDPRDLLAYRVSTALTAGTAVESSNVEQMAEGEGFEPSRQD